MLDQQVKHVRISQGLATKLMGTTAPKSWTPWRVTWTLVKGVGVSIFAFIGWQYWLFNGGVFRTSSFDEMEWKSLNKKTDESSCYRGGMAYDIQNHVLRIGQTRAQVEGLLGMPDSNRADIYEYFQGMCSGLRIDFDTLDVHFGPEGGLVKVQIVQH